MIRIEQLKLPVPHETETLRYKILKILRIRESDLVSYEIRRASLDARRKPELYHIYTVDVHAKNEKQILKKIKNRQISYKEKEPAYKNVPVGTEKLPYRPVIIGTGPAGLFCGYELARMGYRPILLERGMDVENRVKDVEGFWKGQALKAESNVQFGEGGAGTFSDGKLNTLIKDVGGRNKEVLRLFTKYGAPGEICYENKPHIGTDILLKVVKNIREAIISMGGEVRFHSKVTDIHTEEKPSENESGRPVSQLCALTVTDTLTGEIRRLNTSVAVLAIGHSARDTFAMLKEKSVHMEAKSFAVGVRVEHPQTLINRSQYGSEQVKGLPAATYKLTANLENGRGVYTFCMCPGGYVVNASSEEGMLAINGMSYSGRSGENANSAVIVTVTPEDYADTDGGKSDALSGVEFQRRLETRAYQAGDGNIPVQRFGDFRRNRKNDEDHLQADCCTVIPQMKGTYTWGDVRGIFPEELAASLTEGILAFDRKIPGYASDDTIISGVESRTSSPVRILRDESFEGSIKGLYPCGEGAGYAGGITSSATDGLKVSEAVSRKYRPFDKRKEP